MYMHIYKYIDAPFNQQPELQAALPQTIQLFFMVSYAVLFALCSYCFLYFVASEIDKRAWAVPVFGRIAVKGKQPMATHTHINTHTHIPILMYIYSHVFAGLQARRAFGPSRKHESIAKAP